LFIRHIKMDTNPFGGSGIAECKEGGTAPGGYEYKQVNKEVEKRPSADT
jgi:hypothetical protein